MESARGKVDENAGQNADKPVVDSEPEFSDTDEAQKDQPSVELTE